jgi:5-methylcytosine-specific restriction endonuclease McrA
VKHQAHHVIPQELGGPHEWWNMHPAEGGSVHQGGIHRKDGPLSKLVEGAKKNGK